MTERFIIVHRTYDPIQADLLGDLLRDAGVVARVTGTRSGALIGVSQNILEIHIAVPESQAGQATDFLESYFAADTMKMEADDTGEDGSDGEGGAGGGGETDPHEGGRGAGLGDVELRPLLAAGSAFLTFGVGHVYARRPWTAAALLGGQLVAMYYLFAGDTWADWTLGFATLAMVVGADVVGSAVAARAHRLGVRRGPVWQSIAGATYVGLALGLAHTLGPRLADPMVGRDLGRPSRSTAPSAIDKLERPLEREPSFPPLTSQHPANPAARK